MDIPTTTPSGVPLLPVFTDGLVYLVEDPVQPEIDEDEEFRNPRFPMIPYLNDHYRAREEEQEGDEEAEEEERSYYRCKRARIPATSKAILGLQEVSACDTKHQEECAVCLQDFGAEEKLRAMPCSHAFHQDCIFEWLRLNRVCPLCRRALPIQEEEEDDEEFSFSMSAGWGFPELAPA